MRHRLANLLFMASEWLDHGHCASCSFEDRMCCITTPVDFPGCYECRHSDDIHARTRLALEEPDER